MFYQLSCLFIKFWLKIDDFVWISLHPIVINKNKIHTISICLSLLWKLNTHFLLWLVIFIECILHELFIFQKFNLLWIFRSILKLITNVTFNFIFKLFQNLQRLNSHLLLLIMFRPQLLQTSVCYLDKNIKYAHDSWNKS